VKSYLTALGSGLALSLLASAACAENVTVFGYDLNASLRAQVAPTYEGGKQYTVFPGGSLAITRPWEFDAYGAPDDAASFGIVNTKNISFGIAASIRENRGNDDVLQGFRNIGWSLEGGGFLNIWPTKWTRIHAEVLKGLTAQNGTEVNVGLDFVGHPSKFSLAFGPRFSWADSGFNGTYFGVNGAEAAASPYIHSVYTPKAGPRFVGLEANAEYRLFPRWRLTFDASYHRLIGDDGNSPLVRQIGSADQLSAALGVRFALAD
jgi:outer membrane scaffolding protein for murein synthesis (MipA/OmpV family)